MEFLSFGKSGMLLNNSINVGIFTTVTVGFVNEFDCKTDLFVFGAPDEFCENLSRRLSQL